MKKISFFLMASVCMPLLAQSQAASGTTPPNASKTGFSVACLSKTPWNTPDGVPYRQVPGANLGVTSFELLDNNRAAFLSDATSEILIIDKTSGRTQSKFAVVPAPRDFVYDQGFFFVLGENQVTVYTEQGSAVKNMAFPDGLKGVGRIFRYNNATWLLLPSGNCMLLAADDGLSNTAIYKGWITSSGNFINTAITGHNTYSVAVHTVDGKDLVQTFPTDKKVAGVYVVGSTANRIMLDVQTYVTESPICVERHLVSISMSGSEIGELKSDLHVPDLYYVLSDKELSVAPDGTVIEMITTTQGVVLVSLTETELSRALTYPPELLSAKYHFNDHLVQVREQK